MNSSRSIDSVPHRWSTEVNGIVYAHNQLLVNRYYITLGFFHTKENSNVNEIAFEKIEIFFNMLFNNAIIISKASYEEKEPNVDNNIFMTTESINDQSIACLIYLKLASIVRDDLSIEYITISSALGKEIEYTIDIESPEMAVYVPTREEWWKDEHVKFEPWWMREDSSTYDVLINRDEIFEGDFVWDDIFKDELAKIKEDDKKSRFKIINGGKDAS